MGNQVTAHNTINSVRTDIVTETKTLKNCFQELFANMKCKATSQANISGEIDEIVNYLKRTEKNLCSAQQAATALAGVNRKVAEKNISINAFAAVAGVASIHPIDINIEGASQALAGFKGCAQRLELKIDILNRCKKEISALPESEQNISSVSTIDSIFAGLVGGIKSAVTKVRTVKQQCVGGLKDAVSNLQKAISCIRDIGNENGKYAKLITEFEACDANIINRYKISRYSDILMRTRQYNDGNVPAENDLQNEITNVGGTAGSIATVTCESCKELDEEAARLKNLYENHYGFEGRIKDLMNQEGFRNGDVWSDNDHIYGYTDANGVWHGWEAWSCCAMAIKIQVATMGTMGSNAYPVSIDNIKVGDIINYVDPNTDQKWGHWVFVVERTGNTITVAEGNLKDENGVGRVSWNRTYNLSSITKLKEIRRVEQ